MSHALTRIDVTARIRHVATGETVGHPTHVEVAPGTVLDEWSDTFIWSDGNYSCDCNRSIFFAQSGGADHDDQCGDERFRVNLVAPDGRVFYREFDE